MQSTIQSTPDAPTRTKSSRALLSGALVVFAVVALLAGGLALSMVRPSEGDVSFAQSHPSQSLPFGPGWAADYYTDLPRPIPFGPEIAATYGKPKDPLAGIYRLPFGPEIAADYGRPNDPLASIYRLPFGPGWAATYGCPLSANARAICASVDIRR